MLPKQICTFYINQIYFGIDILDVQEIIRSQNMTYVPLAPPDICGLINLRGQIVTVIHLEKRLDIQKATENSVHTSSNDEALGYNIVIDHDSELVGFLVDEMADVLECSAENFAPVPVTIKGKIAESLQATYKLEDGFILILNTQKILEMKYDN